MWLSYCCKIYSLIVSPIFFKLDSYLHSFSGVTQFEVGIRARNANYERVVSHMPEIKIGLQEGLNWVGLYRTHSNPSSWLYDNTYSIDYLPHNLGSDSCTFYYSFIFAVIFLCWQCSGFSDSLELYPGRGGVSSLNLFKVVLYVTVSAYSPGYYYHLVKLCYLFSKHLEIFLDQQVEGKGYQLEVNRVTEEQIEKRAKDIFIYLLDIPLDISFKYTLFQLVKHFFKGGY